MNQPQIVATEETLASQIPSAQGSKSKLILAVDDDSDTLGLLASIGNRAGYTVFIAASGEECLSMLWRVTPQLILLDIKMPGLDGFETCQQIRNDRNVARVPVAFLTARKTIEDLKHSVAVGGDDFLIKPFDATRLVERFAYLISQGHVLSANRARRSAIMGVPSEAKSTRTDP